MNQSPNTSASSSSGAAGNAPRKSIYADIFDNIETFVLGCCILIFFLTFVFRLCQVDGPSMNKTLTHGDKLIISNLFYEPQQFDIVVFHQTSPDRTGYNENIVKRVIATGGHYVKIDAVNNLVYVSDDNVFDENDIIDESMYKHLDTGRWKWRGTLETYVPKGKLFVMGDNRNNSEDSRSNLIGLVDCRRVLGKVILRFSPISEFTVFD